MTGVKLEEMQSPESGGSCVPREWRGGVGTQARVAVPLAGALCAEWLQDEGERCLTGHPGKGGCSEGRRLGLPGTQGPAVEVQESFGGGDREQGDL